VKIAQSFSFVNPIGYTPKFTIDTMRVVIADKTFLDTIFATYGLESNVILQIQKLNAGGTGYEDIYTFNFAVDFESYEVFDVYSEFALKSISVIDDYNKIKNTNIDFNLPTSTNLNFASNMTNSISLKKYAQIIDIVDLSIILKFVKDGDYSIYNSDTAILGDDSYIYQFGASTTIAKTIRFNAVGSMSVSVVGGKMESAKLVVCKNNTSNIIYTVVENLSINDFVTRLIIPTSFSITAQNYLSGDNLFFAVLLTEPGAPDITSISINYKFSFGLKKETEIPFLFGTQIIKSVPINTIFNTIFNNNLSLSIPTNVAVLSGNSLIGKSNSISIKPSVFISDICKVLGLILNYKLDGSVLITGIATYFNTLLQASNTVEVFDFKDLSIKSNSDLSFSAVNVGSKSIKYDIDFYEKDWNKVLSFSQERNANEAIDLELAKYRVDFLGIVESLRQKNSSKNIPDLFFINSLLTYRTATSGELIYDIVTPRDVLINWIKFLSFAFQNYSKNTLTISSDGGTPDNLQAFGFNQMDDVILNETPRLLPIEYNFTALIDNVDFSENILKITHNSEIIYIFVLEAETTDKLTEQKIRGLKIQL